MAGRRPRARGVIRRSPRPGGTWARLITGAATVAGATKVVVATGTLSNAGIGETVRRTRGWVAVASDQVAATENAHGAFGAVVVSDAAVAIGVTAIPGPITDDDDDGWFVWQPVASRFVFVSGVGVDGHQYNVYSFDSKAMRRVEEGFQIAFMFETGSADGMIFNVAMSFYATRN